MRGLAAALLILLVQVEASTLATVTPSSPSAEQCDVYIVNPNDTCIGVCTQKNITYAQLLAWNPLLSNSCSNLGNLTSNALCISNPKGSFSISSNTNGATTIATTTAPIPSPTLDQTTSRCAQYYLVIDGDDCSLLTTQFQITLQDFLFLNPEVWANCTNLEKGYYYCVEPVGYISTYSGYESTTSTQPFNQTAATSLPKIGDGNPLANFSTLFPIVPIANNTRVDCYSYMYFGDVDDNSAADCWTLAILYDITSEELILWNPSLAENDTSPTTPSVALASAIATQATDLPSPTTNTYTYPCTIAANSSYCVALVSPTPAPSETPPPSPRAAGEIFNCTTWYRAKSYSTCNNIASTFYLTLGQFLSMNPSIGQNCEGLVSGTYYCISTYPDGINPDPEDDGSSTESGTMISVTSITAALTPTPIQTGMVSDCNRFYEVKTGDGCFDIAQNNSVPLTVFYQWNPAVKTDCSGLQANVYVCVGVLATSTTSGPTASQSAVVTPTPTQSGMTAGCTKFYDVHSGDGCSAIASSESINLSSFYQWNPAVKTDCSGLQASVYVCVGILAPSSTATSGPGFTTPTPTQSGMTGECAKFYDVHAGDGCSAIASSESINLSSFYQWNPAVKTDCSGLEAGVYVCVGVLPSPTPTPTQTGMVDGCTKFYDVHSGDGCAAIASSEDLDLSSFYAWNPAVKTDCSGLQASVYVCVGISTGIVPRATR